MQFIYNVYFVRSFESLYCTKCLYFKTILIYSYWKLNFKIKEYLSVKKNCTMLINDPC